MMEVFYGDFRRGFYVSESKKKAEVLLEAVKMTKCSPSKFEVIPVWITKEKDGELLWLEPVKGAKKRLAAVRKKK